VSIVGTEGGSNWVHEKLISMKNFVHTQCLKWWINRHILYEKEKIRVEDAMEEYYLTCGCWSFDDEGSSIGKIEEAILLFNCGFRYLVCD
jgi:hypothetical protein